VDEQRRAELRRAYLSLGAGELAAAAVFVVVTLTSVGPRLAGPTDRLALWAALVPVLLVLLPAGTYWLMARRWVGRGRMPRAVAAVFRVVRALDAMALAAGLVGVLVWLPDGPGAATLVVVTWLFGVAEYVNYFVVRLAYPPRRWWRGVRQRRVPRLVQDLRAAEDYRANGQ
jgi:hypothetical protein